MPTRVVESIEALKDLVGHEIGVTEWFVVSQERIRQFAEATEDGQWIHLDRERARKESPYGTTIAHGFLTLSLLSHFIKQVIDVRGGLRFAVNYGSNRVRFPAAVRSDSQIRARVTLQSLKKLPDAFESVYAITVEAEGNEKPCCVAEWIVRYYV
jgi:acyl dehydratase